MNPTANQASQRTASWDTELVVLCGNDRADLVKQVKALQQHVSDQPVCLTDLAYSLNRSIRADAARLAVVASSITELRRHLDRARQRLVRQECQQINDVTGIYYSSEPLFDSGRVAFLFPGEGSQYLGMLDGLADQFPDLCEIYASCDRIAAEYTRDVRPISRFTRGRDRWPTEEITGLEEDLLRIDNAMVCVFMANWAVFAVLDQMGLKPDAVAGHSAGELTALVIANVYDPGSHRTALEGIMRSLIGTERSDCALLAVAAGREVLADVIDVALADDASLRACLAMDNCPHQSIAVGDAEAITLIENESRKRGLFSERLKLGAPYHTPWFKPYTEPLSELFAATEFRRPQLPIYSCTTGELFPDDPDRIRELAVAHWYQRVEFSRMVESLHRDGMRIFVEVGPRNNLTSFVSDILRGKPHLAVPSNVPNRSALTQLNHVAAQLIAHHVPLQMDCFYSGRVTVHRENEPTESPRTSQTLRPLNSDQRTANRASPHVRAHSGSSRNVARDAVLREHFQISNQFLAVQSQIMQQYLRRPRSTSLQSARKSSPSAHAETEEPSTQAPMAPNAARRYPLVGRIVEHLPLQRLVCRRLLDLDEDNYAAHHTVGGRKISRVDPNQHGLPIMPMTFTLEMMMETAATLVPNLKVLGVKNVRLSRWLAFEPGNPGEIELTAQVLEAGAADTFSEVTRQVLVEVKDLGRASDPHADQPRLAALGTVVLGKSFPQPPPKSAFALINEQPCQTDVPTTYNNLFHGELFQGLDSIDRYGKDGIEGTVHVLPRDELFTSTNSPEFICDPVLLDVAMHPAVSWHLEQADQSGRIMLPFELQRLQLYGPRPEVGKQFTSQTRIVEGTHWHYTHMTELLDDSGQLWGKIDRVKLWRFYLPFHDVNFHGPKDVYFLASRWETVEPSQTGQSGDKLGCCCVRLKELNDLKQPALQMAGARVMLSPNELKHFLELSYPDDKKAEWLFGRAAAKDAVRLLLRELTGERLFMADIEVFADEFGKPIAGPRGGNRHEDYPHVSISHTGGEIVAIAATTPHVGIDIERIVPREASFEAIAFDDSERHLLDKIDDRHEAITRFWCAKEAVGKALGRGLNGGPRNLIVQHFDSQTGVVHVMLGNKLADVFTVLQETPLEVHTMREDDLVVATTLCQQASGASLGVVQP